MNYKVIGREWKCDYCGIGFSHHWLYDKDLDKICCDDAKCRKQFKRDQKNEE